MDLWNVEINGVSIGVYTDRKAAYYASLPLVYSILRGMTSVESKLYSYEQLIRSLVDIDFTNDLQLNTFLTDLKEAEWNINKDTLKVVQLTSVQDESAAKIGYHAFIESKEREKIALYKRTEYDRIMAAMYLNSRTGCPRLEQELFKPARYRKKRKTPKLPPLR